MLIANAMSQKCGELLQLVAASVVGEREKGVGWFLVGILLRRLFLGFKINA